MPLNPSHRLAICVPVMTPVSCPKSHYVQHGKMCLRFARLLIYFKIYKLWNRKNRAPVNFLWSVERQESSKKWGHFMLFSVLFTWFVSRICMQLHRKSIEIEDQTACFWWRKAMLLKNDNWRKSVISSMIMRYEKRPKFASFQSLLPLVANTRVFRRYVKIFRSSLVATHCL